MYRTRDLVAESQLYTSAHLLHRVILLISGSRFRPLLCHCTPVIGAADYNSGDVLTCGNPCWIQFEMAIHRLFCCLCTYWGYR